MKAIRLVKPDLFVCIMQPPAGLWLARTFSLGILTVLGLTTCPGFTSCKLQTDSIARSEKIIAASSAHSIIPTNSATIVSVRVSNDELTQIYTQAIAEFIKVAYRKDKTTFDTLYFGKHVYGQPDDFPEIELPTSIENTQIRLVSPEVGQKLQAERKSLVYVNMMGWVDKEQAEFVFVVFTNDAQHQYDYFINFSFNPTTNKFELDKIEFENYLGHNGQKPKREISYNDGKYVRDQ